MWKPPVVLIACMSMRSDRQSRPESIYHEEASMSGLYYIGLDIHKIHIANRSSLQGVEILEGNVLRNLESEVGVGLKPADFAARADMSISSAQSRAILGDMGVNVPNRIVGKAALDAALRNSPRLTSSQTQEFFVSRRRPIVNHA